MILIISLMHFISCFLDIYLFTVLGFSFFLSFWFSHQTPKMSKRNLRDNTHPSINAFSECDFNDLQMCFALLSFIMWWQGMREVQPCVVFFLLLLFFKTKSFFELLSMQVRWDCSHRSRLSPFSQMVDLAGPQTFMQYKYPLEEHWSCVFAWKLKISVLQQDKV